MASDLSGTSYTGPVAIGGSSAAYTTSGDGTLEIQAGGKLAYGTGTMVIGRQAADGTGSVTGTVNMTGGTITGASNLILGQSANGFGSTASLNLSGNAQINLTGGLWSNQNADLTVGSTTTLTLKDTARITMSATLNLGQTTGAATGIDTITVDLSGGTPDGSGGWIAGSGSQLSCTYGRLGRLSTGTATMTIREGATFTDTGDFNIGTGPNMTSKVVIKDNGQWIEGGTIYVGASNSGQGTLEIKDNAYIHITGQGGIWMADYPLTGTPAVGVVNQTGGTVELTSGGGNALWLRVLQIGGNGGQATYTLSGGTINLDGASNGVGLTWTSGRNVGTFHLDGGTLITPSIHAGSPWSGSGDTANFYFNGGTLKASGSSASQAPTAFMYAVNANVLFNVYVSTGGAIIDSNGFNMTINPDVYSDPDLFGGPDGGLTKNGPGILTFNGFVDYNGPTQVNGGTLRVNNYLNSGSAFNVESGAAVGGSGFLLNAPVLIKSGGAVSPGTTANAGTLTLKDLTMQPGALLNIKLGTNPSAANDLINVQNNLSFGNTLVTVNPYQGSISGGDYPFLAYVNLLAGNVGNLSFALNAPYTLDNCRQVFSFDMASTPGQIKLHVTPGGSLTWTNGSGNGLWDVAAHSNPAQGSLNWTSGAGADKFYDGDDVTFTSAGGPWNVTLADNVYPANATMDLAGGTLSMGTKNFQPYTLLVSNSTINTGTGSLSAGTLQLTNSTLAAGGGNVSADNFLLDNSNVNGTGTLNVRASAELRNGTINMNLTGTSGFSKTTAGTVTLKGTANAETGGNNINVREGTLIFDTGAVMTGNSALVTGTTVGQPAKTILNAGANFTGNWVVTGDNDLGILKTSANITANNDIIVGGTASTGQANGYLEQAAGTTARAAGLSIADSSNSFGSYLLNGTLNITTGNAIVGNNNNGLLTITSTGAVNVGNGGLMSMSMGYGAAGDWLSSMGVVVQRGGSVSLSSTTATGTLVNQMQIQVNSGVDVYNQLGGTVSAPSYDVGAANANLNGIGGIGMVWYNGGYGGQGLEENLHNTAIYNLNGGTLSTSNIHSGSVWNGSNYLYAYLNFHGGTLQAAADSTNFIYHVVGTAHAGAMEYPNGITAATVYKEGAVIDTNGHNIRIQTALVKPDGQGVSSIPVLNGGAGYLSAPIIRIDPAITDPGTTPPTRDWSGIGATAIAEMVQDPDGTYHIGSITITNPGTGYVLAPIVTIIGGNPATAATLDAAALAANDTTGGLTKTGSGTLTLAGNLTYGGTTTINAGTLQINTPATAAVLSLAAVTGASSATLGVGDGTNATDLTVKSVAVGTLNVGAGSTLTIAPITGGPLGGAVMAPVPEPSTITLLALAGLGMLIAALRKRRS